MRYMNVSLALVIVKDFEFLTTSDTNSRVVLFLIRIPSVKWLVKSDGESLFLDCKVIKLISM